MGPGPQMHTGSGDCPRTHASGTRRESPRAGLFPSPASTWTEPSVWPPHPDPHPGRCRGGEGGHWLRVTRFCTRFTLSPAKSLHSTGVVLGSHRCRPGVTAGKGQRRVSGRARPSLKFRLLPPLPTAGQRLHTQQHLPTVWSLRGKESLRGPLALGGRSRAELGGDCGSPSCLQPESWQVCSRRVP